MEALPDDPVGTIRPLELDGVPYVAVRHADGWAVLPDDCPHATCPFSTNGEVVDDYVLICNCHGSEFDLRSGEVLLGPATESLQLRDLDGLDGA